MIYKYYNEIEVKTKDEKYHYIELGNHSLRRVWVSSKLVETLQKQEYYLCKPYTITKQIIKFPTKAVIHKTEKGTLILKPSDEHIVHCLVIYGGFRGESSAEVIQPKSASIINFWEYRSPRGRLGIDEGLLVQIPANETVWIRFSRSGRLYGEASKGLIKITPDAKIETFENIESIEELQELEKQL